MLCIFVLNGSFFAQVSEDFSDGDFTAAPVWNGTTGKFIINGTNQLQSNGSSTAADTLYLTTANTIMDSVAWQFYMHLDFNPTASTNYVKIYLVSDQADLTGSLNGYYLRIGETGSSDTLELWRQDGNSDTQIMVGTTAFGSTFDATIKVTRDQLGNWALFTDPAAGSNFTQEGTVLDNTYSSTQQFGFYCKYSTTSRFDMYYFDDINIGQMVGDTTLPFVQSVTVLSDSTLDVLFSEPVDPVTAQQTANYSANNSIGTPLTATIDGGNDALVHLLFSNHFVNGQTNTLTVQSVEDQSSNVMNSSTHDYMYFVAVAPNYRSVVINEIFADPSPQIGLPAQEYIELYNPSSDIFNLENWTFSDPSSSATLGNYLLQPNEYVIIADDDFTFDFSMYSNVIYVTTLPSLNNSSDQIYLRDNNANLIDFVSYSSAWYQDAVKDDGGYSLEQINPESPCANGSNWIGSNHSFGGTPGSENSVYSTDPDVTAPEITTAVLLDAGTVSICFDEALDSSSVNIGNFSLSNSITVNAVAINVDYTCVTLTLNAQVDTGIVYQVTVNGPTDCWGNIVASTADLILPHVGEIGDIIINEVLFNPYTGGDDFVEIYNNSSKYIDLNNWFVANWDDGDVANYKMINQNYLLSPGEYCVLTKDSTDIKTNYLQAVEGTFLQMSTLPTYSNDSGTVYLVLPDSSIADGFSYREDMHFALINDPDGISLERIDFDRATNDATNWHSAAESAGWATPGKINSQYVPGQVTDDMVTTSPEIFSPDNDGIDDVFNIQYTLEESGIVGNIVIFDAQGRIIRNLMQNELLAREGIVSWDGLNDNREKARVGMYVIYFEFFDLNGNVSAVKKSCVLASKL